jgi:hypothetical protein
MPLHLESFGSDNVADVFQSLLDRVMSGKVDSVKENNHTVYMNYWLQNSFFPEVNPILQCITTLWENTAEKQLQILDVCIASDLGEQRKVICDNKLKEDLGTTYLDIADKETDAHISVELLMDKLVPSIEDGTEFSAKLTIYTYQIEFYKTEEELTKSFGFTKPIKLPGYEDQVISIGDNFTATSSIISKDPNDIYSLVVGRVQRVIPVRLNLTRAEVNCFVLVLKTAFGTIPCIINKNMCNISEIKTDDIVKLTGAVAATVME